jgi:hypothetical protein
LVDAIGRMSILLTLRFLPFAVYAICRQGTAVHKKLMAAVAYLAAPAMGCALGARSGVAVIVAGWVYILVASVCVNPLSRALSMGVVTRGGTAVAVFFVFLLVPGLLLPGDAIAFLLVAWEIALSSYSYCIETARGTASRASTADCLFFLLVNPTVVYTMRGKALTSTQANPGIRRFTLGFSVYFAKIILLRPLTGWLWLRTPLAEGWTGPTLAGLALVALGGGLRVLTLYAEHSGLASMHIGAMRQLGWEVPERYRYPLAATSPMDFWRRWNTYVRVWLESYVFVPIARRVARKTKRQAGQVVAALATLIVSGVIHDALQLAIYQRLTYNGLAIFVGAAAVIALWRGVDPLIGRVRAHMARTDRAFYRFAAQFCAHGSVAGVLILAAVMWP